MEIRLSQEAPLPLTTGELSKWLFQQWANEVLVCRSCDRTTHVAHSAQRAAVTEKFLDGEAARKVGQLGHISQVTSRLSTAAPARQIMPTETQVAAERLNDRSQGTKKSRLPRAVRTDDNMKTTFKIQINSRRYWLVAPKADCEAPCGDRCIGGPCCECHCSGGCAAIRYDGSTHKGCLRVGDLRVESVSLRLRSVKPADITPRCPFGQPSSDTTDGGPLTFVHRSMIRPP